jgi:hypothetical protein
MAIDMDEQLFRQKHGWSMWLHSGQAATVTPGANEATERLFVTHVFLVDPESAHGQGVVVASVQIGTRNTMKLAALSSETPRVALKTPVELDAEFSFDVRQPGGDYDSDADPVVVEFQGYALPSASTKGEIEEDDDGKEDIINNVNHEKEEGDGEATEDDEDAMSSNYEYHYDSRDDGEVCGLPLGTVIDDWPRRDDSNGVVVRRAATATAKSNGAGGNGCRRRRRKRFITEGEGRSFGVPVRSPQFDIHGEHRRRVPPEAVVLGIFVFLYLMAMVAVFIHG